MGCIYRARNTINGKCYIGKTVKPLRVRRAWHRTAAIRGEGFNFHRAIRKYGFTSFVWDILAESSDPEELGRLEIAFIASLNTKSPNGYNLTNGGDGVIGLTPESRAKVTAFHKGRKRSEETRRRLSEAMTGKQNRLGAILSDETKAKISVAHKGGKHTEEHNAKIGAFFRGKPKTPEQKSKMSVARKAWWNKKHQDERERQSANGIKKQAMLFDDITDGDAVDADTL